MSFVYREHPLPMSPDCKSSIKRVQQKPLILTRHAPSETSGPVGSRAFRPHLLQIALLSSKEVSMSLLGKAAVAMWWNIRLEQRSEFGDWHSHEHFPERMSIPGFRRGSRWTSTLDAEGFFVLYELDPYETLTSKGYLDRLNAPTPWSTEMMPHHLNMVRSQCRVVASFGGGVATSLATVRLAPQMGRDADLKKGLIENLRSLVSNPGLTGAHLLITDTPKTTSATTEQQIRGSDSAADWIVLVSGYDPEVVEKTVANQFSSTALHLLGAQEKSTLGLYKLAFTMTSQDVVAMQ